LIQSCAPPTRRQRAADRATIGRPQGAAASIVAYEAHTPQWLARDDARVSPFATRWRWRMRQCAFGWEVNAFICARAVKRRALPAETPCHMCALALVSYVRVRCASAASGARHMRALRVLSGDTPTVDRRRATSRPEAGWRCCFGIEAKASGPAISKPATTHVPPQVCAGGRGGRQRVQGRRWRAQSA